MLLEDGYQTKHTYNLSELMVFNMLVRPVWVFDIERTRMLWANQSALPLWSAESVDELVNRDFAHDLTESTELRMKDQQERLCRGEMFKEQWTIYPGGKATTLHVTYSGIRLECDGQARVVAMVETEVPDDKKAVDASTIRAVEMIRHLPLAVSEFGMDGKLNYQNPHSVALFGPSTGTESDNMLSRFVDQELGKSVLKRVQNGEDCNVEDELYTVSGPRWIAASIRRVKDPVHSEHVILYSARDITEVIQARKDTTKANLKGEFFAVVAHEIRTPLHHIIGFMDLLEASSPLTQEQRTHVEVVQSSTALLMSIINSLLDYSQLENGKLQLEIIPFDLKAVLNACIAAAEKDIESKGVELRRDIAHDIPTTLKGDPNRLRQIMLNLLSNARKFTSKGIICLTATIVDRDPNQQIIRFEVSDTGIGIDESVHKVIFEKYQQAHASVARNYGGTGLGLGICKDLTALMNGKIWLKSERGRGTTFFVEIPFEIVVGESIGTEGAARKLHVSIGEEEYDGAVTSLHVLVVEDNLINQKICRSLLQRIGHTVTVANNGQVALDQLRQSCFDIVLMDVQMPVMDGIECTKQIRSVLGLQKDCLPVVGLTASFHQNDLGYYQDIGMNDALGKPVRMEALKRTIHQNMRQVRQHRLGAA